MLPRETPAETCAGFRSWAGGDRGGGGGTKTLTGITISQAVEATRNVPSPEKAHNLCLHVSICSLRREKMVVKSSHLKVEMHKETNNSEQV